MRPSLAVFDISQELIVHSAQLHTIHFFDVGFIGVAGSFLSDIKSKIISAFID